MGLFDKLAKLFQPQTADYSLWVKVKCNRCGEELSTRVNLANDLSSNYSDSPNSSTYFCRKVIVGDHLCFQKIEVQLNFDSRRKLTAREISGGEFIDD